MCGYFCIGFIDFKLKGKSLKAILKMSEATNMYSNDQ